MMEDLGQADDGVPLPQASLTSASPTDEDVFPEIYLGAVKSYNDRRGFGFLACSETADQYGRDVYMPKAEATIAALDAAGLDLHAANTGGSAGSGDGEKAASEKALEKADRFRLAEEDFVRFRVRLSIEGYPQAAYVQRIHKYTGVIKQPPAMDPEEVDPATPDTAIGVIVSEEAAELCGRREVPVRRAACGFVRLVPGDEVVFCLPQLTPPAPGLEPLPGTPPETEVEAKLVFLSKPVKLGTVLGCVTLDLPRSGTTEGAPPRPNVDLPCHAFGDKLILAGLPSELDEAELMRFFSKQSATGAIVAHARTSSFASVTFPGIIEVARFLGRTAHAFADEKETRIARLKPLNAPADMATLPALPAPTLDPGEESGSLLVVWSPLVLAVAYSVELRPASPPGPWAMVDVTSNRLGPNSNRFNSSCSSCKVSGLAPGTTYEARVSYFTDCGTRSEASEASDPCAPAKQAPTSPALAPAPAPSLATRPREVPAPVHAPAGPSVLPRISEVPLPPPPEMAPLSVPPIPSSGYALTTPAPTLSYPPQAPPVDIYGYPLPPLGHVPAHATPPPPWTPWAGVGPDPLLPPLGPPLPHPSLPPPEAYSPPWEHPDPATLPPPAYTSSPGWRTATGLILPAPAAPELRPADNTGCAISVQWPAVLQASAYVVELREAGSPAFERFVRTAPDPGLTAIVELVVGGLRPSAPPGRVYMAQVRAVGPDGSESAPSPPGWSPPLMPLGPPGGLMIPPPPPAPLGTLPPLGLPPGPPVPTASPSLSPDAPPWQPLDAAVTAAAAAAAATAAAAAAPRPDPSSWNPHVWLDPGPPVPPPATETFGAVPQTLLPPPGAVGLPEPHLDPALTLSTPAPVTATWGTRHAVPSGAPPPPPPPPVGPPPLGQLGVRKEDPPKEVGAADECLILD